MDWTEQEVRLIVEDYFKTLEIELSRRSYNKSSHNQALRPHLNNRSKGSIDFKQQNISAALINMGLPYIKGYKPRINYQKQLVEKEMQNISYRTRHLLKMRFNFSYKTWSHLLTY